MTNAYDLAKVIATITHHRLKIQEAMGKVANQLEHRAVVHDESKFFEDELEGFAEVNRVAREHPYGSPEYKASLKKAGEKGGCIAAHYRRNSHHPEHWAGCEHQMDFLDIIEMVCDWWAAWKVYDHQRPEGEQMTWRQLIDRQRERFGQLKPHQWWLVDQVAAFLEGKL